ncbi:MAG: ATP-dependent helicase, partial [Kangiellaceae bacterium]|nr:ATP-dependent helicase [Kangiellaceae bacterium]
MIKEITLNAEQKSAVEFGELNAKEEFTSSPLLIIAGAGTGKTNTLAHRTAHLILNDVEPERILLMTFSRRAAKELVERTKRIAIKQLQKKQKNISSLQFPWMGTFHSIANRLLRQHAKSIGFDPGFTIIDRNDAEDLIDVLRHELGFSTLNRRFPKKSTCLNIYSRCINAQSPLPKILKKEFSWCEEWLEQLTQLFSLFTERKIQQVTLDYDDLLLYWYHLVDIPEVAQSIRSKFDHVLIDEYQDTNVLQAGILTRLFPDGRCVTVVGDDAQSIYSFRSAEVENIINFPELFSPPAKIISLKQNYRSTQPILDLANSLLAESKIGYKKELFSAKNGIAKPKLVTVEDDLSQAKYIVDKVLVERESGTALREQAVLFRSSHHSDRLEVELMRHDIPFVKYGGLKFLEAAHVKDLLSIIRWADNPKQRLSGFRILKLLPGVGPATAMKALDLLELNQFQFSALYSFAPPSPAIDIWHSMVELLCDIQKEKTIWPAQMEMAKNFYIPILQENYDDDYVREGDITQLSMIAQQYATRESFVSELTLDPPILSSDLTDKSQKEEDFLILSTVHSAKGQEWKNVFLLNVADGSFPNEYAAGDNKAIEEERRLLNVAITRAKQGLHLIQPLKYWIPEQPKYGDGHVYGAKSRFLTDTVSQHLESTHWPIPLAQAAEPGPQYNVL